MSATGYIQPRAFTGQARIPLENVAIAVTALDGTALAMRLTDRSGLTQPIALPVPDLAESQRPDPDENPFAQVNLYARLEGYEQIEIEDLQIFADTTTDQPLEMIPLSEFPENWGKRELFFIPPQNL